MSPFVLPVVHTAWAGTMLWPRPTVPVLTAAMVPAGSITLCWGPICKGELAPTPPVGSYISQHVNRLVVNTGVTKAVLLGATTEAVLRATKVLRVRIALCSRTILYWVERSTLAIGSE